MTVIDYHRNLGPNFTKFICQTPLLSYEIRHLISRQLKSVRRPPKVRIAISHDLTDVKSFHNVNGPRLKPIHISNHNDIVGELFSFLFV